MRMSVLRRTCFSIVSANFASRYASLLFVCASSVGQSAECFGSHCIAFSAPFLRLGPKYSPTLWALLISALPSWPKRATHPPTSASSIPYADAFFGPVQPV